MYITVCKGGKGGLLVNTASLAGVVDGLIKIFSTLIFFPKVLTSERPFANDRHHPPPSDPPPTTNAHRLPRTRQPIARLDLPGGGALSAV